MLRPEILVLVEENEWVEFSLFQKVKDSTLIGTKSGCHIILGSISKLLLYMSIVYGTPTVWELIAVLS